ncbi:uncharacterized membrane protein (UPF0127 family) [Desulfohalotomaculum tongense]|uniref:DUF192 domain-containing protein n=1 Tax=Desulforadius tongensis TaxID=1216062 RepID=UPI00195E3FFF|nr:DUF192 domain-containing protein [Desulforadius tongensis]MBM7855624.1 uncharacterized membrane protein (UPF0127 family) [Desulforadius tongensis]
MPLINVTRSMILAKQVEVAETFKARLKGLIGTSILPSDRALLIRPCSSVHTFFMKYPIDVIFLDKENRILKILHSLPPYRFSPLVWNAKMVLELPAGRCRCTGTRVGDLLKVTYFKK